MYFWKTRGVSYFSEIILVIPSVKGEVVVWRYFEYSNFLILMDIGTEWNLSEYLWYIGNICKLVEYILLKIISMYVVLN